jgi:hypothetical protein
MRTLAGLTVVALGVVLSPVAARAGERVTDAALGAISGAVVAGPVGLVAGGVIGYVAGPQIGCDLGVERCYRHRRYRHTGYSAPDAPPRSSDRRDHSRGPGDLGTREDHGNY